MKLYGVPLSQPFRSVAWTLLQLELPFQVEMAVPGMNSKLGTHHENFRKLTPHRSTLVPLLTYTTKENEENPVVISESPAIMAHVCETFGTKQNDPHYSLYPPPGTVAKAHVDSYMHWHHSNTRLLARLFQTKVRPDMKTTLSEQDYAQLHDLLHTLNSGWLLAGNTNSSNHDHSSSHFIGGLDHPTIADILAYGELSAVTMTNLLTVDPIEFSVLHGWMKEMAKLPHHDHVHQSLVVLGNLAEESQTPISKRLGAATKAGIQGLVEAQESYSVQK